MWTEMMRMSEHWHAFHNRKEASREEKAPSVMSEGRRESWEVESKDLVTEVRQKRRTRQRCEKVDG